MNANFIRKKILLMKNNTDASTQVSMMRKRLEKYLKEPSTELSNKEHARMFTDNGQQAEQRKKTLNKWAEKNKKETFEYIFNEKVKKIKTFQLTDDVLNELEEICKEIYNTGYCRGVREGILD